MKYEDPSHLFVSSPLSAPARFKIFFYYPVKESDEISELKFKSPYVVPFSALQNLESDVDAFVYSKLSSIISEPSLKRDTALLFDLETVDNLSELPQNTSCGVYNHIFGVSIYFILFSRLWLLFHAQTRLQ